MPVTADTPKDWLVTLLLSIFLGSFGVDRSTSDTSGSASASS
jgi:TM2 domain.